MGVYDIDGASDLIFENLKFLSTKEAAAVLRLSENALRIMVYRGQIQSFKLGSRLRFRENDCLALFVRKGA
jgi:excisionase family DNA binding protein